MRFILAVFSALAASLLFTPTAKADTTVHKRSQMESSGGYVVREATESWRPSETAIIVCDMWDSHHCLHAVRRCVEMAPRMNEVLKKARDQGMLIVHAPSSCMDTYKDHPGRKIAHAAPRASNR